jgi:hypothetical protein
MIAIILIVRSSYFYDMKYTTKSIFCQALISEPSNSHFEAMLSKNVGQAVSLSGLEQANSLSYDTLTAKMRIAVLNLQDPSRY